LEDVTPDGALEIVACDSTKISRLRRLRKLEKRLHVVRFEVGQFIEDLPYRLGKLLGSKKLGEMGKAAKSLGRARAAETVCLEVLERMEKAKNRRGVVFEW
jgi:hypothetical protein